MNTHAIDAPWDGTMDELSIAQAIVGGVDAEIRRLGGFSVDAVHLQVGEEAGVRSAALLSSFERAARGTSLARSRFLIEDVASSRDIVVTALEVSA